MTLTFNTEKHPEFIIFPVLAIVWHLKDRELYIEMGLIKHTLTIHLKTK
jgi:hypothetical protein